MSEEEKEESMDENDKTFYGIKSTTIGGKIIEFPTSHCLISSSYLGRLQKSANFAEKVKSGLLKIMTKDIFPQDLGENIMLQHCSKLQDFLSILQSKLFHQ